MTKNILFLFLIISFTSCSVWDGGYRQSRIDLNFVNENNEPLQNVELKVFRSRHGKESYYWPISNYDSTNSVLSDSSGLISLYHKRYGGFELGGWSFLGIIRSRQPSDYCKFYYNDKLIYKIKYYKLYDEMRDSLDFNSDKDTIICNFIWPSDSASVESFYHYKKTVEIKNRKIK